MPFQFRLQSVLSLKASLEEQTGNELAILNAKAERAQLELEALRTRREDLLDEMGDRRKRRNLDAERILAEALYLERLNAELQIARQVLQRQRALAAAKRAELVGISRERKVLEKLKEKHQARYQKELDRKDATLAGELFLARHNRDGTR